MKIKYHSYCKQKKRYSLLPLPMQQGGGAVQHTAYMLESSFFLFLVCTIAPKIYKWENDYSLLWPFQAKRLAQMKNACNSKCRECCMESDFAKK